MQEEPLAQPRTAQHEPHRVHDEGTVLLEDLDRGATRPVVGVGDAHVDRSGLARGGEREAARGRRGERALGAAPRRDRAAQERARELREARTPPALAIPSPPARSRVRHRSPFRPRRAA